MPISIYPPTLQSTQPAFLASVNVYQIYFTLQSITSFNDIGHIQVRIVRQSNNKSIVNTNQYPDGTIYKAPSAIGSLGNQYFVSINKMNCSNLGSQGIYIKCRCALELILCIPRQMNLQHGNNSKQMKELSLNGLL